MAVLLTGAPGVGKTTIIEKLARAYPDKTLRGFVTQEMRRAGRRVGFELCAFGGRKEVLAHVDLDSPHRVGRYGVNIAALDDITEDALTLDDAGDLYLVDEIGKMECLSTKFCSALRALFESGRPLVATVAQRGGGFIREVKDRADVEVWEATRENRNELPELMADILVDRLRL